MYPQTTFQLCNWIFGKKILQSWNLILPPLEYRTVPAENIKMHPKAVSTQIRNICSANLKTGSQLRRTHKYTLQSINDYEKYTLKLRTGIIKVQIVFPREGIPCHVKFGRVLYFACSSHVALTFGGQCTFCRDIPLRHWAPFHELKIHKRRRLGPKSTLNIQKMTP